MASHLVPVALTGAAIVMIAFFRGGRMRPVAIPVAMILALAAGFVSFPLPFYPLLSWCILAVCLTIPALEDARSHSLPLWQLIPVALSVALVMVIQHKSILPGLFSAGGLVLLLAVFSAFTRGKGLGLGDLAVFGILGFLFHPAEAVLFLLFASFSATIYASARLLVTRKPSRIAFIPFIGASALLVNARGADLASILGLGNVWISFGLPF